MTQSAMFTILSWTFTLFSYSSFLLCTYPCVDHMIDITSSPFYFPYHSWCPTLSMPSHSDLISLLSRIISLMSYASIFHLICKPLIYLIILCTFSTFCLIVLYSALFPIDVLLHLSLGIDPHCHPTKFQVILTFLLVDSSTYQSEKCLCHAAISILHSVTLGQILYKNR